jgi:aminopeptidase N
MTHPRSLASLLVPLSIVTLAGCNGDKGADTSSDTAPSDSGAATVAQDILTTDLQLDLANRSATATIVARPASGSGEIVLEAGGLSIQEVRVGGAPAAILLEGGTLRVPVSESGGPATVAVDYTFPARTIDTFDGWMPNLGVTFTWPDHCANLFPCHPGMDDGVTFRMDVTGVPAGETAVYGASTVTDAPAYMAAVAVGDYTRLELGTTTAGTDIVAYYLPVGDAEAVARHGTAHLVPAFDFFEQTYGPYAFGPESGSVQVDWGWDSYGGMEHHPYSHVASFDFGVEEVHVHEAAHAWFGDGVRLQCWEDFVLSEGTVTYMASRGLEEAGAGDLWDYYMAFLDPVCNGGDVNTVALPDETCNEIDFENAPLWSMVPYMKGACFYEEVADAIGVEALDSVIADFYVTHVNGTGRMQEMIDAITARATPAQRPAIEVAVQDWLRTEACPADYRERCTTHPGW